MMRILAPALGLLLGVLPFSASSHELWIEPLEYQVAPGGQLQARLFNGENFVGTNLPYLPQRFRHFVVLADGRTVQVPGRAGDTPALNMSAANEGLHIVGYQSNVSTISYEEWAKFQKFADHKDFKDVRSQHDARGLPDSGFMEAYTRFSKSLIGVGAAAGSDKRIGLETEIVALTNPYTDDISNGMQVQLFYGPDVRANEQIEVFAKTTDEDVVVSTVRTNDEGIAMIPVTSGTTYQLDAVVLREPSAAAAETGAVWETLWANLTFQAP